ncbi:MAG: SpoIIE family protein phosphatase [Leptospiraceae bacterium]|nr:SpoIIE family protein phosphatase [Leptospiraceae bacterium]
MSYFFFGLTFLNIGYLMSGAIPFPVGANHRYITVGIILFPTVTYLVRYAYHIIDDLYPREAKIVFYFSVIIDLFLVLRFFYLASTAVAEFNFRGDIYDYPQLGKYVALALILQILFFIIIMIRKAFHYKNENRKLILQMMFGLISITLIPSTLNVLMKKGSITPELFHIVYSICFLLGGFITTIVFINNAIEKTSFMTKVVGISAVTFLLLLQILAARMSISQEKNFDMIHNLELKALITGKNYSDFPTLSYLVSFPKGARISESASILYKKEGLELEISKLGNDNYEQRYIQKISNQTEGLFFGYRITDDTTNITYEAGFPYLEYRKFIHNMGVIIIQITLLAVFILLLIFPIFFYRNIGKPLRTLLEGFGEVKKGNLRVSVPLFYQDEIGTIGKTFNRMVIRLFVGKRKQEEYAGQLEQKVKERTREVVIKMKEIEKLKIHQDGDYFLTSLIQKPLITNWNRSREVTTDFFIKQIKTFEFRNKKSELGGDICISGNLKFDNDVYVFFVNGDAMGKSMQGAGGAIVLGTVVNYMISRSTSNKQSLNVSPKNWLETTYHELNQIFHTFDGLMMISVVMGLIHIKTGEMFFYNAEHPWLVLYRDKKAEFIENELTLRKIGSPSEYEFSIQKFQLHPGDVLIGGSDGRDDIDITPDAETRTINEDETLFLRAVERGEGNLETIYQLIKQTGRIIDDLSMIRIGFHEKAHVRNV